ncbi:protein of unknown function [Pararobbsia alpina]
MRAAPYGPRLQPDTCGRLLAAEVPEAFDVAHASTYSRGHWVRAVRSCVFGSACFAATMLV